MSVVFWKEHSLRAEVSHSFVARGKGNKGKRRRLHTGRAARNTERLLEVRSPGHCVVQPVIQ